MSPRAPAYRITRAVALSSLDFDAIARAKTRTTRPAENPSLAIPAGVPHEQWHPGASIEALPDEVHICGLSAARAAPRRARSSPTANITARPDRGQRTAPKTKFSATARYGGRPMTRSTCCNRERGRFRPRSLALSDPSRSLKQWPTIARPAASGLTCAASGRVPADSAAFSDKCPKHTSLPRPLATPSA